MRFSVCLDSHFGKSDLEESFAAVKRAGFDAIEFWSCWEGRDIRRVKALCDRNGLHIACFCAKHMELTDPCGHGLFIDGLSESIEAAKLAGVDTLISAAGPDTGLPRAAQRQSIMDGLRAAAPLLEDSGITLVLEPLNAFDHKEQYLRASDEAFEIVDEVGSPRVKVLFDIYHQQITEGNIISRITANISKIGHIHTAGVPGRHELDTGELNYPNIFAAIERAGYAGYIGLEYYPLDAAEDGFRRLLAAL